MSRPVFKDTDPKIRAARDAAYKYLHIMLRDRGLGGKHLSPRTLAQTLKQELLDRLPDPDMMEVTDKAQPTAEVTAQEYDPEREAKERQEQEARENELAQLERLKTIVDAMRQLADPTKDALEPESVRQISSALASAPAFIAGQMLPTASQEQVGAEERLGQVDDITREMKRHYYHGRLSKDAIEATRGEQHDTKDVLVYVHQRAKIIELALSDLHQAVETVNAAFEGRTQGRAL